MSNWINVKDQLPKIGERVIYLDSFRKMIRAGAYHSVGSKGAHYFISGNRLETAKWWMPTPELPEEEI